MRTDVLSLAAVDLGASNGRVVAGQVGPGRLMLSDVRRFPNVAIRIGSTLHWDLLGIYREVTGGLAEAARRHEVASVGIDSWAVDYGLVDGSGALLGNPVHYRDGRTGGLPARAAGVIPPQRMYDVTGLRQLQFNTVYQLMAEPADRLAAARHLLLIPDLIGYWLTGRPGAEVTNASTTGLYDVRAGTWAASLCDLLGIPASILPALRRPGELVGPLLPHVRAEVGAEIPVLAVGSHDTASSVVAVPAAGDERFAYISSGTWSLVGVERETPVLTEQARAADFSNEGGVDGRVRFLRNVMGLWLLQECMHAWSTGDIAALLRGAAAAPRFAALIDPDDPRFLAPGDMPARIADFCRDTGQRPPGDPPATVRCVFESLALAYRRALRELERVTGTGIDVVYVIGGGARNELLCQLTADACARPVVAGPDEASAMGNLLVQARALGAALPNLEAMRSLVRSTQPLRRHEPQGDEAVWRSAEARAFGTPG